MNNQDVQQIVKDVMKPYVDRTQVLIAVVQAFESVLIESKISPDLIKEAVLKSAAAQSLNSDQHVIMGKMLRSV